MPGPQQQVRRRPQYGRQQIGHRRGPTGNSPCVTVAPPSKLAAGRRLPNRVRQSAKITLRDGGPVGYRAEDAEENLAHLDGLGEERVGADFKVAASLWGHTIRPFGWNGAPLDPGK